MSKKCCGIIYKDEKFCTMCGKELISVADIPEEKVEEKAEATDDISVESKPEDGQENTNNNSNEVARTQDEENQVDETDDEEDEDDEDDEEDEEDDGTASGGLKFFGTLMILLMIASIVAVGLGVYFIMLNPFYRNHDINNPVVYEQMATDTDVTDIQTRPGLTETNIDSVLADDVAPQETATQSDATETDASEDEASEDME